MSAVWTPAATLAVHTEGVEEHALAHICPRSTVFQIDAHPNRAQAHLSPSTWSLAWAVLRRATATFSLSFYPLSLSKGFEQSL